MKAFLHIGTPKTGTTNLQQFLHSNREELIQDGILYPEAFGLNSMSMVVASYDHGKRDGLSRLFNIVSDEDIDDLRSKLNQNIKNELLAKDHIHTVLLSSEYFQLNLRTSTELDLLKSSLNEIGFTQIYVVVYLREQGDLANSFYSTAVKAGETAAAPPPPSDNRYRHLCDHKSTLEPVSYTHLTLPTILRV